MRQPKVGDICTIQRTFGRRSLDHEWKARVARITPKRAYFDKGTYFELEDKTREVKPRYLDYVTTVVAIEPGDKEGGTTTEG